MRWLSCVLLLLGLAACDAARPGFYGAETQVQEVEGSRFTLRFQGNLVEATRTSPEWLPRFEDVTRKAGIAAQIQSGCRADWVEGDPAMMWIGLSCDGRPAPKRPRRSKTIYSDIDGLSQRAGTHAGALTCRKGR
ncbi:hypothetical protein ANTHELSMS3_01483 [Antarctobacter heliothermus]|uniref:Lipoprotein n=1 Tax=Antarctobacter heliothermus TaxID=74033 RepID=A0A222E1X5_9RHOB|nr:hypothetical protein [Antarctobacter heliothermus]ASP20180.1 hypothetical protein ANTHELSMS3_01483 [Antarctobacter heliothermus]